VRERPRRVGTASVEIFLDRTTAPATVVPVIELREGGDQQVISRRCHPLVHHLVRGKCRIPPRSPDRGSHPAIPVQCDPFL